MQLVDVFTHGNIPGINGQSDLEFAGNEGFPLVTMRTKVDDPNNDARPYVMIAVPVGKRCEFQETVSDPLTYRFEFILDAESSGQTVVYRLPKLVVGEVATIDVTIDTATTHSIKVENKNRSTVQEHHRGLSFIHLVRENGQVYMRCAVILEQQVIDGITHQPAGSDAPETIKISTTPSGFGTHVARASHFSSSQPERDVHVKVVPLAASGEEKTVIVNTITQTVGNGNPNL